MEKIFKPVFIAVIILLIAIFPFTVFSEIKDQNTLSSDTGGSITSLPDVSSNAGSSGTKSVNEKLKESIILYVGSPAAYVNGRETRIDPANMELAPVNINNRTMVPVRFIAESLGGKVTWDQKSLSATILLDKKSYKFIQGSSTMLADGVRHNLDAAVQVINDRTYVPLDNFVKSIGRKVFYDRGLIIICSSDIGLDRERDGELINEWVSKLSILPVVGSRDKLMELLEKVWEDDYYRYGSITKKERAGLDGNTVQDMAAIESGVQASGARTPVTVDDDISNTVDYSTTNVQVQGVDEGDIVKTDGSYIYQVNRQRIVITKVNSPENMKITSVLNYSDKGISPVELYLHGNRMIVIGSSRTYIPINKTQSGDEAGTYSIPRYKSGSVKDGFKDFLHTCSLLLIT